MGAWKAGADADHNLAGNSRNHSFLESLTLYRYSCHGNTTSFPIFKCGFDSYCSRSWRCDSRSFWGGYTHRIYRYDRINGTFIGTHTFYWTKFRCRKVRKDKRCKPLFAAICFCLGYCSMGNPCTLFRWHCLGFFR